MSCTYRDVLFDYARVAYDFGTISSLRVRMMHNIDEKLRHNWKLCRQFSSVYTQEQKESAVGMNAHSSAKRTQIWGVQRLDVSHV
jgi:hypothetical protein